MTTRDALRERREAQMRQVVYEAYREDKTR